MANHAFITTKKHVSTGEAMGDVLDKICKKRFNGLVKFYLLSDPSSDDFETWGCSLKEDDSPIFSFWIPTKRKIEMRHPHGGEFVYWIWMTIQNELAIKLDGMITDEGVEGKWRGDRKYPTFRSWMFKSSERPDLPKSFWRGLFKQEISRIPKPLQKWAAT